MDFTLYLPETNDVLAIVTQELPEPRSAAYGDLVFDGLELAALVAGVEADRFLPEDLTDWCARKRREPEARLDREAALAGVTPDPTTGPLSLAQVLRRLNAELVAASPRAGLRDVVTATRRLAAA